MPNSRFCWLYMSKFYGETQKNINTTIYLKMMGKKVSTKYQVTQQEVRTLFSKCAVYIESMK